MRFIIVALMAICAAGCTADRLERYASTPQERELIRAAIQNVAQNDASKLSLEVQPDIAPKIAGAMPAMRAALPEGPFKFSFQNGSWSASGNIRRLHAIYSVQGKNGWALVDVTAVTADGRTLLNGLYIQRLPGSPWSMNAFRLADRGASGWMMLVLMIGAGLTTIAAVVRIWRSGLFVRRWLWTIGSLISVTSLKLDWSTGGWFFQPFMFQFFGLGAVKQPIYGPWVLSVSLPVVAIIALMKPRRRDSEMDAPSSDDAPIVET